MKHQKPQTSLSRRKFLRNTAITGGVAAASVTAPGIATADSSETTGEERPREGYRLTQHILDYYKSAAS
jgi:hypothetical protein